MRSEKLLRLKAVLQTKRGGIILRYGIFLPVSIPYGILGAGETPQ